MLVHLSSTELGGRVAVTITPLPVWISEKLFDFHALIHLINGISTAIDQRETTVGVFLDLSKAFDTIDNEILFAKLEHYGIRDVALQWIKSYFSYRRQFVQINQTCSSTQTIKCGVPQGSILGPLFFILYINDLPRASKLTEPLLFADDTSIFFSHSNPNYLENVLNNELLNIDVWLKCIKPSINVQKTNYVIFRPSQRKVNHSFSLSFGCQPLTQNNVIKFLGVYLDEHLTWKYHRNFVCKQIAKSVGILSRTRFYLSCKTSSKSIPSILLNSCSTTTIICCLHFSSICLWQTVKSIHITQEQPVIIACIPVAQISKNLHFFTKDPGSGTVFLPLLPICQFVLKAKC